MQFSGTTTIAASRAAVWDFLMDFDKVSSCGPGVDSLQRLDATHARAKARVGVGFISATFTVDMELVSVEEPERATIVARGGAPGTSAEATARMVLSGAPEGPTSMAWEAEIDIFGSLAGVGSRMIEGTADRMIGQTFDCIRSKLEHGDAR